MGTIRRAPAARAASGLAVALLLLTGGTSSAQAAGGGTADVRCGDTLTASTRLRADLTCPEGDGLTLGAGVTLDLGGHTLTGPGGYGAGVDLGTTGRSALVNGTVRGWGVGAGAVTAGPALAEVSRVTFESAPVQSWGGDLVLRRSTFVDSPVAQRQGGLTVIDSDLRRSPVEGAAATVVVDRSVLTASRVDALEGSRVTVRRSTLDGTGAADAPARCSASTLSLTRTTLTGWSSPLVGAGCDLTVTRPRADGSRPAAGA